MAGERTQMGDENENYTGVVSAEYGVLLIVTINVVFPPDNVSSNRLKTKWEAE